MPTTHRVQEANARVDAALADPTSLAARIHAATAPVRDAYGTPDHKFRPIAYAAYAECEQIEREMRGNDDAIAYWQRQQARVMA